MLETSKFDAHVTSMDASMCPVCECLDGLRECDEMERTNCVLGVKGRQP
jgi:hypothetical protein